MFFTIKKSFSFSIKSILLIIKEELFWLRFIFLIIFENSKNLFLFEVASYKIHICSWLFNSEIVLFTICFSSGFLGSNNPGVSTKIIWQFGLLLAEFSIFRIPFVENLVVWTFLDTIEIFWPIKWLIKVDLPTLGGPTK